MLAISEEYKLSPEALHFTDTYLGNLDLDTTCQELSISTEVGQEFLRKKEVKRFIDAAFLEQGYMNRFKVVDIMTKAINDKLEEALETGVYGKESLMEMLKFMHQMRMDEAKLQNTSPRNQTNVQVNNQYGNNLSNLLDKIQK